MIKTEHWVKSLQEFDHSPWDEIEINEYRRKHNMDFAFIKNGFGIHTLYGYVSHNQPERLRWEHQYHLRFYKELRELYDTSKHTT